MTKLRINENNIQIIDLVDPIDPVDPEDPVDPVDPKTPVNPEDKDSKVDQNNSNKNNQGNNSDVKIINSHSGKINQELLPKTNEKKINNFISAWSRYVRCYTSDNEKKNIIIHKVERGYPLD